MSILVIIAAVVCFWLYVLFVRPLSRLLVRYLTYSTRGRGQVVQGTILESTYYWGNPDSGKPSPVSIAVEHPNLSGTLIKSPFHFTDTRPAEKRFAVGKSIELQLRPDSAEREPIVPVGSQAGLPLRIFLPWLLAFLGSLGGLFYLGSAILARHAADLTGMLSILDRADSLRENLLIFGVASVLVGLLFKMVSQKFKRPTDARLRMHGLLARAQITGRERTGAYINEQPEVAFAYSFTDRQGITHHAKEKVVVDLLDLAGIDQIKEKEVIYLPDNPAVSAWMENVGKKEQAVTLSILILIFYAMILAFSVIVLIQFAQLLL